MVVLLSLALGAHPPCSASQTFAYHWRQMLAEATPALGRSAPGACAELTGPVHCAPLGTWGAAAVLVRVGTGLALPGTPAGCLWDVCGEVSTAAAGGECWRATQLLKCAVFALPEILLWGAAMCILVPILTMCVMC
jgi:hypothetical protein